MMGRLGRAAKRVVDLVAALLGILLLSPFFLLVAVAIRSTSRGPVFYRQTRIGASGQPFQLLKFRSMVVGADRSSRLTPDRDQRITAVGRLLRATHFDEIPQLGNVLVGHMSLVGPRPEVPEFVDLEDPLWRKVLSVRPGMTSPETLVFRRQGADLAKHADPVAYYRKVIRPRKLLLQARYVDESTFWGDIGVVFRTFAAIVRHR